MWWLIPLGKRLKEIEKENKIRVLLAVEVGSRAWNNHSPNSDYDIRFIFVHGVEYYLRVDDQSFISVLELGVEGDHDISGWELKKV